MEIVKERVGATPEMGGCADVVPGGPALNAKARQILEGARSAFHELGYEGTSVDEVARRAGVSKPTLYTYFGDKQALFAASFAHECQQYQDKIFRPEEMAHFECVESALRVVARRYVTFFLSGAAVCMFRSAVAEAARFPQLGQTFFKASEEGRRRVMLLLDASVKRGFLAIEDTELASHQFIVLCKADTFHGQLFGVQREATDEEVDRIANAAVNLFLNGYRKRDAAVVAAAA